ncbi:MAG: sugar ABC transporter permease [Verrucomicrobia bacterium]|nr:sugar ABC transporter permease [Verrucomicrobiota bacterium]MBV9275004.1 sugar ABC transporter permease [Verrucomicrobiota bacterium]
MSTSSRPAIKLPDRTLLLLVPGIVIVLTLFLYPFLFGFILSFLSHQGPNLGNYTKFFSTPFLSETIWTTLWISLPATLINIGFALPVAFVTRRHRFQRALTAILVIPITLGTVLIAEGLLTYLGPQGWLNRLLLMLHISTSPVHLTHNYWGVFLSLVVSGFPFAYLLLLSYLTGIDPALPQAAATLGASPWRRFIHIYLPLLIPGLAIAFCLSFVQAFSVFPSAVLLGAPAGPTRVISIAAYQAAFEDYDYPMASAIAMVMAGVQLLVVALALTSRNLFYRGPTTGGKG